MQMTFGEAMLDLIKRRGLSATAVAEDLGFKSKTAFFRILHDESRLPGIKKCFDAAKKSTLLALDESEIARLREAVSVSELGRKTYRMNAILHKMIYPEAETTTQQPVLIEGIEGVKTLEELIQRMLTRGKIYIALFGRCPKEIIDRFHRLTQEAKIEQILHLLAIDEEDAEDIKAFAECSNILFSDAYHPYYLNETKKSVKYWWLHSSIIILGCLDDAGQHMSVQLGWMGEHRYRGMQDDTAQIARFWMGMYENIKDQFAPLKIEDDAYEPSAMLNLTRYVDFTEEFRKLEQNRAIYMIKPDLPIICVPAEILGPMVMEGVKEFEAKGDHEQEKQFIRLYEIHRSRVQNLYEKKKPTHIVLNVQAMMNFAKTGRRTDHFFLGRSYTREERAAILTLLRDQARDNPNFFVWFSANDNIVDDREVTIYDGYGISIIKADTSWRIERDYREVMLEGQLMMKHFRSYFMSSVLGKEVMTQEETIAILDRMIETAKQA